jgi:hypothetical protein
MKIGGEAERLEKRWALPSVVISLVDSAGSERDSDSTFSIVSIRS